MKKWRLLRVFTVLLPVCMHTTPVTAGPGTLEEDPARQVHWAMGAFFGTGWYRVDENRTVYILRIPLRQTLRESFFDEGGKRKLGVEISYPVSIGLNRLEDIPDFIDLDNFGTISFTPGILVEIPVTRKWYLRPYLHAGYGMETTTGDSAWIYYGGIKSRYRLSEGRANWSLLNGVYYAGYKPEYRSRGRYGSMLTGIEFNQPLEKLELGGDPLWLNWHLTYNYLFDRLDFHVDRDVVESIDDQWEFGLALSKGQKRMKIWFLSFEHVGISFNWSSNGRFKAISLNLSSPFTD